MRCPVCNAAASPDPAFAPLLRCGSCRFMFLGEQARADLYGDDYFASYEGGDYRAAEQQRRHESRLRLDLLARFAPPPGRLLELGAAAGYFLDEARARGYQPAGVELNETMAAHARDELGLDVQAARLEEANLEQGAYDAAAAFHVIEHVDDPAAATARLHAALRPGGHLLVEVPNAESAVARRQGADWPALDLPYHVGHHGPRSMRTLLEIAGFEVLVVDTVPFAHYAPSGPLARRAQAAREALRGRSAAAVRPAPHPHAHQLLRAVARRPA